MTFPERLVVLHRSLSEADIPHAFGGAIALAFSTLDPRGTDDIDINVFVPAENADAVLAALPAGVEQQPGTREQILRDGQIRLWWEAVPVDLFFDYDPIHTAAARHVLRVPYEGIEIPVLGPVELAVFKAMFGRSQDWVDIESMVRAEALDVDAVRAALAAMLGPDDERFARLDEAVRRGTQP